MAKFPQITVEKFIQQGDVGMLYRTVIMIEYYDQEWGKDFTHKFHIVEKTVGEKLSFCATDEKKLRAFKKHDFDCIEELKHFCPEALGLRGAVFIRSEGFDQSNKRKPLCVSFFEHMSFLRKCNFEMQYPREISAQVKDLKLEKKVPETFELDFMKLSYKVLNLLKVLNAEALKKDGAFENSKKISTETKSVEKEIKCYHQVLSGYFQHVLDSFEFLCQSMEIAQRCERCQVWVPYSKRKKYCGEECKKKAGDQRHYQKKKGTE